MLKRSSFKRNNRLLHLSLPAFFIFLFVETVCSVSTPARSTDLGSCVNSVFPTTNWPQFHRLHSLPYSVWRVLTSQTTSFISFIRVPSLDSVGLCGSSWRLTRSTSSTRQRSPDLQDSRASTLTGTQCARSTMEVSMNWNDCATCPWMSPEMSRSASRHSAASGRWWTSRSGK